MGTLIERTKQVERNKRFLFLGVEGAGVAMALLGHPFLGIVGIGAGAYFGWQWFKYRARNGMRF